MTLRRLRGACWGGVVLALSTFVVGCGDDSDGPSDSTATPAELVAAYGKAISEKDGAAYESLLDADFEFFPPADALSNLPWLRGATSWDREAELEMIEHMFDPSFPGSGGAAVLEGITIRDVAEADGGAQDITCDASIQSSPDGPSFPIVLVLHAVPQGQSALLVRSMREERATTVSRGTSPTWAELKDSYRRQTRFTDPAALIAAYFRALEECDLRTYAALLAPEFEYFPYVEDPNDFPWMTGAFWPAADELRMIGHMMDPHYVGDGSVSSVDTIDPDYSIISTESLPESVTRVRLHAHIRVLWGPSTGAMSDVILEFDLVPGTNGTLLIRAIRELLMAPLRSVEPNGWGQIKGLYY